jgi:hypothetical protein
MLGNNKPVSPVEISTDGLWGVRADGRVIMGDPADAIVCSGEVVKNTMLNCLQISKICARCLPQN